MTACAAQIRSLRQELDEAMGRIEALEREQAGLVREVAKLMTARGEG